MTRRSVEPERALERIRPIGGGFGSLELVHVAGAEARPTSEGEGETGGKGEGETGGEGGESAEPGDGWRRVARRLAIAAALGRARISCG
jgi:hypothetical protein